MVDDMGSERVSNLSKVTQLGYRVVEMANKAMRGDFYLDKV